MHFLRCNVTLLIRHKDSNNFLSTYDSLSVRTVELQNEDEKSTYNTYLSWNTRSFRYSFIKFNYSNFYWFYINTES